MKGIYAVLTLFLTLILAGCLQRGPAAGVSQNDLTLMVEGTPYQCGARINTVIEALGSDYAYSESLSCDYDGLDKTYRYGAAEFYTYPAEDGDRINEIYTQNPEVATSKGLTVGAAKAEVVAAYGEPSADDGYQMVYRIEDAKAPGGKAALCFDVVDDTVSAIYVTAQTQALEG